MKLYNLQQYVRCLYYRLLISVPMILKIDDIFFFHFVILNCRTALKRLFGRQFEKWVFPAFSWVPTTQPTPPTQRRARDRVTRSSGDEPTNNRLRGCRGRRSTRDAVNNTRVTPRLLRAERQNLMLNDVYWGFGVDTYSLSDFFTNFPYQIQFHTNASPKSIRPF